MRDSGIEWIGRIPDDWEQIRLRFLCSITTGNMDTQNNNPEGEYPFYVRSPIVERSDNYTFDNEAVLMAGDGVGAGKVFHYVNGKYGCHQRVYSLSNFTRIHGKYLFYFLKENFYRKIEESNAKSTVDSVRLPMLKDFPVVFPDKEKQNRIISYLDEKSMKIDFIITKQKQIVEKLRDYKLSVITESVTKGLKLDVEMKSSGMEWIGEVPKEWKAAKLGTICDRPITYGIVKMGDYDENGVKALRCSDVQAGYVDETNIRTVTKELSDEYSRTILKGGEVVINVRGTLGGCAEVPEKMRGYNIAREVAMVAVSYAEPRFVMYNLLSLAFKAYQDYCLRGVIYMGLNINLLNKYVVFLPSIEEQNQIVKYLDHKCSKIDNEIKKRELTIEKLQEYRRNLIYEVVTGKKEV